MTSLQSKSGWKHAISGGFESHSKVANRLRDYRVSIRDGPCPSKTVGRRKQRREFDQSTGWHLAGDTRRLPALLRGVILKGIQDLAARYPASVEQLLPLPVQRQVFGFHEVFPDHVEGR